VCVGYGLLVPIKFSGSRAKCDGARVHQFEWGRR
jgi:hypothetical protein